MSAFFLVATAIFLARESQGALTWLQRLGEPNP